ncbi:MAG: vitamin K epoxide reductase family protein [Candidatus Pacearchaeota archaeon]
MKYKILIILFGISLISSIILSVVSTPAVCIPNSGCDIIQTSPYNSIFGIKNSYFGIIIFSFLIVLTFLHIKNPSKNKKIIIHMSIILGSIVSLYFLYLQKFVLEVFCKYCLIVDISILICFLVMIFKWKE